jgi:hypothetical protein
MKDPCQPIASPRAASGTTWLTWSTVAVIVGAHSRPATKASAARGHTLGASASGKVARLSPPSSTKAGNGRCHAP